MEKFIQKYENGRIKSKISIKKKDDVEIGKIEYFFWNGVKNYQISYKNGEKNGKVTSYYNNGNIRTRIMYRDGIRQGHCIHYYENGIIKIKLFYRNDLLNGKYLVNFPNGNVQAIIRFKNNKRHGKTEYYNSDGSPSVICHFKDDKLCGKLISFYDNNLLKIVSNYKNGSVNGYERKYLYHPHKKEYIMYYESRFKDNKVDGKTLFFYANGNILMSISYKNNKRNGISVMYDFDGKELYKHYYVNDHCLYKFINTKEENECCVCYETIQYKTKCSHFICSSCFHILEEKKCPICRNYF
jgi:antitoxin component YwqK of YwqJK toxin-antitoxin module